MAFKMGNTMQYELHRQILEVVARIPSGCVASYGQVAQLAGLPKHARFVGYILCHLDEASGLPWHRVINSQGRISTQKMNDQGENIQYLLLLAEGIEIKEGKINLRHYGWKP
ncbi:MAG: MGMT family protein [Acinetobacter sp.]